MTIVIFFSNGITDDTDDERKLGSPRLAKGSKALDNRQIRNVYQNMSMNNFAYNMDHLCYRKFMFGDGISS